MQAADLELAVRRAVRAELGRLAWQLAGGLAVPLLLALGALARHEARVSGLEAQVRAAAPRSAVDSLAAMVRVEWGMLDEVRQDVREIRSILGRVVR